jgi:hypothetical protein
MALQPFVWPWSLFQFLDPIQSRQDTLGGGSVRRKAFTHTRNNTNRINARGHPYLDWDSNPAIELAKTYHALDSVASVIGRSYIQAVKLYAN